MESGDFYLWNVKVFEECEIKCPECNKWSDMQDWKKDDVPCEVCGEHEAIVCPKCGQYFDHVWSPEFESREKIHRM